MKKEAPSRFTLPVPVLKVDFWFRGDVEMLELLLVVKNYIVGKDCCRAAVVVLLIVVSSLLFVERRLLPLLYLPWELTQYYRWRPDTRVKWFVYFGRCGRDSTHMTYAQQDSYL